MHHPPDRIAHTMTFVIQVVEHWLVWEIAQWVCHDGSIRRSIAPWVDELYHHRASSRSRTVPMLSRMVSLLSNDITQHDRNKQLHSFTGDASSINNWNGNNYHHLRVDWRWSNSNLLGKWIWWLWLEISKNTTTTVLTVSTNRFGVH